MELNFLGTVSITKQVLAHMTQRQRAGTIVTVSSIVGLAGAPLGTGYAATKHALQVLVLWFLHGLQGRLPYTLILTTACVVRRVSLILCGLS